MYLVLTAINNGQFREFSMHTSSLEEGLEATSRLAVFCDRLLTVKLVDETTSILYLPPQAFDGQPIHAILKQLEQQWQEALASPAAVLAPNESPQTNWYKQQVVRLRSQIAYLQRMIDALSVYGDCLQTAPLKDADRFDFLHRNERARARFHHHLTSDQDRLENYNRLLTK